MKPYIFMEKNGIHIIDLQKTLEAVEQARAAIVKTTSNGKSVLMLGTKPQAKNAIKEQATRGGMPYVTERWLGGTLTNFNTVRKSLEKLEYLEKIESDGTIGQFHKKEALKLSKEKDKLLRALGGIREMHALPGMIFIVDTKKELNAVLEAKKLNIPIIGIIDTNADPDQVDYPIPANDDAMRAINLFCTMVADASIEGKSRFLEGREIDAAKASADAPPPSKPVAKEPETGKESAA